MNQLKWISFFLLLLISKLSFAQIDLASYQANDQRIQGKNYPRIPQVVYQKINQKTLQGILESYFDKNIEYNNYSEMFKGIRSKIRGHRIDNDLYDYLYETKISKEIKKLGRVSSKKSYGYTQRILTKHYNQLDPNTFEDIFLKNKNSVAFSIFNYFVSGINQLKSSKDYYVVKLDPEQTNLFDYGYYLYDKKITSKMSNIFLSPISNNTMTPTGVLNLRADNTIRYGFFNGELNGEPVLYVFDGKMKSGRSAKCITRTNQNRYHFCDKNGKVLMEEPSIIGILVSCNQGQTCSLSDDVWKDFNSFSKRRISSEDLKQIESAFEEQKQKFLVLETPMLPVQGGSFPAHVARNEAKYAEINDIAQKDATYHGLKVKKIYTKTTTQTDLSITYELDDSSCSKAAKEGEECLSLNEAIYLIIPEKFHDIPISEVIIAHRQNPKDNRGKDSFDSSTGHKVKDQYPSFIAAQIYNQELPYKVAWRYWGGHVSGINGGKYSEHKKNGQWEYDNLYEWPLYGHRASHQKQKAIKTLLTGKYIRVIADEGKYNAIRGYDKAYVHSVTVKFLQDKADEYETWSFTNKKTRFGDPISMLGRQYGGGPKFNGTYPGAIILKSWTLGNTNNLNRTGWNQDRGKRAAMEYDLPVGKKLKSIEIAAGDTHPDGRPNKDGGIGSLGGAKLYVQLITKNGKEFLIEKANLGPKGVTIGHPMNLDRYTQAGDKIRIYSTNDRAYIMGIRLGYDN